MRSPPSSALAARDGASLDRLLRATSRTFALGIVLLPPPLRTQVRVAYLVLRVSDYLEDNRVMSPAEKVRMLRLWHRVLHRRAPVEELVAGLDDQPGQDPIPDLLAARQAGAIFAELDAVDGRARAAIARHAGRSTLGMARWVRRGPHFEDEADLDDYMHEVAGRVGHLLTDLFGQWSPRIRRRRDELMRLGREFGLALQTVNVIRGMSSDRRRGWIFVPRSFLPPGMAPAALFEPENRPAAMDVLARLSDKAARHLEAAVKYVTLLPRTHARVRLFCELPLFFGARTLAASRGNPSVLTEEVKIGRRDVRAIARRARAFGGSNAWVRWYAGRLGGQAMADGAAATPPGVEPIAAGEVPPARIGILVVSDRAFQGVYEDRGGPAVRAYLERVLASPWEAVARVVPDEEPVIREALAALVDADECCLVVTTGGTGPAPRDVTPEATLAVIERELPGFGEAMRTASLRAVPTAVLSRQTAGVRGRALIVNLPGSPKAVPECLDAVFAAVPDCVDLIGGPRLETDPSQVAAWRPHD